MHRDLPVAAAARPCLMLSLAGLAAAVQLYIQGFVVVQASIDTAKQPNAVQMCGSQVNGAPSCLTLRLLAKELESVVQHLVTQKQRSQQPNLSDVYLEPDLSRSWLQFVFWFRHCQL